MNIDQIIGAKRVLISKAGHSSDFFSDKYYIANTMEGLYLLKPVPGVFEEITFVEKVQNIIVFLTNQKMKAYGIIVPCDLHSLKLCHGIILDHIIRSDKNSEYDEKEIFDYISDTLNYFQEKNSLNTNFYIRRGIKIDTILNGLSSEAVGLQIFNSPAVDNPSILQATQSFCTPEDLVLLWGDESLYFTRNNGESETFIDIPVIVLDKANNEYLYIPISALKFKLETVLEMYKYFYKTRFLTD